MFFPQYTMIWNFQDGPALATYIQSQCSTDAVLKSAAANNLLKSEFTLTDYLLVDRGEGNNCKVRGTLN